MCHTEIITEVETEIPVFISYSHRDGEVHLIEYFVKLVADTEFRLQSSLQREAVFGCEDTEQGDVDVVVLYLKSSMPSIEPNLVPCSL